jgi:hypothetical protein
LAASARLETPVMICPKCRQPGTPDRGVIVDETVYNCKTCDLYTVEGAAKWVKGGAYLINTLRSLSESRDSKTS